MYTFFSPSYKRRRARYFCILLLLVIRSYSSAELKGQNGETDFFLSDKYILEEWSIEDGLPVNSINKIIKTNDGYLWFSSHDGLIRFDGLDFKVYTAADNPGLRGNRIQHIAEALNGDLLIQSEGLNIMSLSNGTFTHLMSLDPRLLGNGNNMGFYRDDHGVIWFGSHHGIYNYDNGVLKHFEPETINIPVHQVVYASGNEVWFFSPLDNGIYRYKNNRVDKMISDNTDTPFLSFFKKGNSILIASKETLYEYINDTLDTLFTSDSLGLYSIAIDDKDTVHIATVNHGFFHYTDGQLLPNSSISKGYLSMPYPFMLDNENTFWTITNNKLYENGRLVFKSDIYIRDLFKDEEGNIWIATSNSGLIRLKQNLFTTYSTGKGLTHNPVYPLFQSSDSSIWIGTYGKGINRLKGNTIEAGFEILNIKDLGFIQTFVQPNDSTILVGALNTGIQKFHLHSKISTQFLANSQLAKADVFSLFIDSKQRLWIGSDPFDEGGLYMLEDKVLTKISGSNGVPYTKVRFTLEAPNKDLWFATQGDGILHFDSISFKNYTTQHGLSSDFPRALYSTINSETNRTILWIGYEDKGLDRIEIIDGQPDFENITNYQLQDGLFDNSIHIILEDSNNRFWFNTNRGISWVSISELEDLRTGKISHLHTKSYTEDDGLLNREGNGGIQPAGFKDYNGAIWFPSQNGIVTFHPDSILGNNFIPPIVIQDIITSDSVYSGRTEHLVLPENRRDIQINYASLSFLNSKKNQFAYMLEGYDDSWNLVGTRRTAFYTKLPAGTYTFKVRGSNNEGIWNEQGTSFRITISPFFYETKWLYLILAVILFFITLYTHQFRHKQFYKREKLLKKEVELRTRELLNEKNKTEHQAKKLKELDEMKSKFFTNISHEFRTPLTLIIGPLEQSLSQQNPKKNYIGKAQKEMMLRNSKQLLKQINQLLEISKLENGSVVIYPQKTNLPSLLDNTVSLFNDFCTTKQIQLITNFSFSHGVAFIDRDKIVNVFENLISNAIKFTPIGGEIKISLTEKDSKYIIKIRDTGVGISEHYLPKIFDRFYQVESDSIRTSEGTGLGLAIAKEFIELHSGSLSVESKKNQGTTFIITLLKGNSHFKKELLASSSALYDDLITHENHKINISTPSVQKDPPSNKSISEDSTTIIIVDDNKDIRKYISFSLSRKYRIIEAKNGKEAYKKIKESLPDLIIADIMMPEMDGIKLNKHLKKDIETSSIPLIFLTAKEGKKHRLKGIKEGADVYLTKPFDMEELLITIENLFASRFRLRKQILNELRLKEASTQKDKIEDPFLRDLYQIMEFEFSNPNLTVTMIKDKLFMSRSTFYRKTNEKTGLNTQQFVNTFRLGKAKEMLIEKKGSISEIAYACGFNSLSYFSRSFKEKYGKSPSEFLKSFS